MQSQQAWNIDHFSASGAHRPRSAKHSIHRSDPLLGLLKVFLNLKLLAYGLTRQGFIIAQVVLHSHIESLSPHEKVVRPWLGRLSDL